MYNIKESLLLLLASVILVFISVTIIPNYGTYKVDAAKVNSFGYTWTKGYSRSVKTDKGTYKISDGDYYIFLDISANKCYDLTISRGLLTGEFISGIKEAVCNK